MLAWHALLLAGGEAPSMIRLSTVFLWSNAVIVKVNIAPEFVGRSVASIC